MEMNYENITIKQEPEELDTGPNKEQECEIIRHEMSINMDGNEVKIEIEISPVKEEPDDSAAEEKVKLESDLYENCKIKEELTIGPTVFSQPTASTAHKEIVKQKPKPKSTRVKKKRHEPTPYRCKACFRYFIKESSLLIHIYNNRGQPFKCKKKHTRPNIFYYCAICNKRYSYKHHLIRHMKVHFRCRFCSETFPTTLALEVHLRTHLKFKCNFCMMSYEDTDCLTNHIKEEHGEKPYKCDICHSIYATKNKIREHMIAHSEVRKFSCNICNKMFKTRSKLTAHKLTHNDAKPFRCSVCMSRFKSAAHLRYHHKYVHSGIKYSCTMCEKVYTTRYGLTTHEQVHHQVNIKVYKCEICHKQFKHNPSLKRHMNMHGGIKPFICIYCSKSFSDKLNLRVHIRNVHEKHFRL